MAASRFLIAGLILFGWSIARAGRAFRWPTIREWRDSAIVGALLLGGGMGMVAFGEQTVASGIAALFIAMMPVWVAVLGRVFLGERLPRLAVVGIVLGFAGVAILVGPSAWGGADALEPVGAAALLLSPIAWSIGSLFASHRAVLPQRPLISTGAQMLVGRPGPAGDVGLERRTGRFSDGGRSRESLIATAYLTLIGSL